MTSWTERSFDTAADLSKQVLTLSTAVVALSITFLTDIAVESSTKAATVLLAISWAAFALSILLSICTLMCLAGVQAHHREKEPDIYSPNIVFFSFLQFGFFLLGLILTGLAIFIGLCGT